MKVGFWTLIEDLGDGSAITRYFPSREAAQQYKENQGYDVYYLDDVTYEEFILDSNGLIVT